MHFTQGDIVVIKFPFTNFQDWKLRPAIVISNSHVNGSDSVLLAQMTTTRRNDAYSFLYDKGDFSTPLIMGEIRCHRIFTAEKTLIKKKISSLNCDKQKELLKKILTLISIDC